MQSNSESFKQTIKIGTRQPRMVSFNCNGLSGKIHILNDILSSCDILCLQDHHLLECSTSLLSNTVAAGFNSFISPATPTGGRPSGGTCIIVRSTLAPRSFSSTEFFTGIMIGNLVLFSTYLPTDYRTEASEYHFNDACARLQKQLVRIPPTMSWCIAGDLNCNVCDINDPRACTFLSSLPPHFVLPKVSACTYIHWTGSTSNLDHVIVSTPSLSSTPVDVLPDFPISDHLPLSVSLSIPDSTGANATYHRGPGTQRSVTKVSRVNWQKEKSTQYREELDGLLSKIVVPEVSSHSSPDRIALNILYAELVHCIKTGASHVFGEEKYYPGTRVYAWKLNSSLVAANDAAKAAFLHWRAAGSPRDGPSFNIMKITKSDFRRELRHHNQVVCDELAYSFSGDQNKVWDFVRNRTAPRGQQLGPTPSEDDWISTYSETFRTENPFLSTEYETTLASELTTGTRMPITITPNDVENAVKKLKSKKSYDHDGLHSNHLKFASPLAFLLLSCLFNLIIKAGKVPDSFTRGTTTPVLKKGNDSRSCSSYRPITVSCQLSKVFELCLLRFFENCDQGLNQIGFQKGLGCDKAHSIFMKILSSCSVLNKVFVLSLDIAKAYDSVVHAWALLALARNGVPTSIIFVLKDWYSLSRLRVRWNRNVSDYAIRIERGLRQGSILSPVIFNISLATCLNTLPSTFIFQGFYLSWLAYADDVLLLSRSLVSLQRSADLLGRSLERCGLKLKPEKCKFLVLGTKLSSLVVYINGLGIKAGESFTYLGLSYGTTIQAARSLVVRGIENRLRASYGAVICLREFLSRKTLARIFNTVALPQVLIGSSVFPFLTSSNLSHIRTSFFQIWQVAMQA